MSIHDVFRKIKMLQTLTKERKSEGCFIIEGKKIIREFLEHNKPLQCLIFDEESSSRDPELHALASLALARGIEHHYVRKARFTGLSAVKTPQGVLGIALLADSFSLETILSKESVLIAVGENIQDPTNAGILVRNCLAFGFNALIFTENSADVLGPKAVRVASSCILDLPVFYLSMNEILKLKNYGVLFYSSALNAKTTMESLPKPDRLALIFGNEGEGISEKMKLNSDQLFYIPISPQIDSLNITSAAAIVMYHFSNLNNR